MSKTMEIVSKVFIKGSIQDVWREITKTDEQQACMFNMRLHTEGLAPGAQVRMRTANGKYTGVVGEVLEFDPPHRYSHTFKFTNYDDPPCTVTYELEEVEGGVNFTLRSTNVPLGTKTEKQMRGGGDFIVSTLKAVVETGRAPIGKRILFGVFKLMEPFSPASTRTENWPFSRRVESAAP